MGAEDRGRGVEHDCGWPRGLFGRSSHGEPRRRQLRTARDALSLAALSGRPVSQRAPAVEGVLSGDWVPNRLLTMVCTQVPIEPNAA